MGCNLPRRRPAHADTIGNVGTLLDYLIKTFLLPLYPDVKLGEPFELPLNMERIEIRPEGVRVMMKK